MKTHLFREYFQNKWKEATKLISLLSKSCGVLRKSTCATERGRFNEREMIIFQRDAEIH